MSRIPKLSVVNRRCLQALLADDSSIVELLKKVATYHLGSSFLMVCQNKKTAAILQKKVLEHSNKIHSSIGVDIKIATTDELLYVIPAPKSLELKTLTAISISTMPVEQLIEEASTRIFNGSNNNSPATPVNEYLAQIARILNTPVADLEKELLTIELSPETISSLTADLFKHRLNPPTQPVEPKLEQQPIENEPVAESTEPPTPTKEVAQPKTATKSSKATAKEVAAEIKPDPVADRATLKALGLPMQLGILDKITPASNKDEAIVAVIQQGIDRLNPNATKHSYILKHIVDGTEAGQIYTRAFAKVFAGIDSTPSAIGSRPGRIKKAAASLYAKLYPEANKPEENEPIAAVEEPTNAEEVAQ